MSERHSSEFDDRAALPPHLRGPDEDDPASGASPVPPSGEGLSPAPPSGEGFPPPEPPAVPPEWGVQPAVEQQWGAPPPPLGLTGAQDNPPPSQAPSDYPPPERPGAHRTPTNAETTSIVDRQWLAEQVNRGTQGRPQERQGPGNQPFEPDGPTQSLGPRGAAPGPDDYGRPGLGWPERPPQGPGPSAPPASDDRLRQAASGGWPQHPVSGGDYRSPQPPAAGAGAWPSAQGSAASWNYVDNIRSDELVPTRRIPPGSGWRKVLYLSTFKLINPGQSPDERYEDELEAKVRSLLRGTYKIGVLGKGGVGKSTIAAGVGSIFAELRQDDRVVAVDADTAFGKLAARIDPQASGSYWELAADRNLNTFADMRSRVGSNPAGLFVLGGAPETARRRVLDPAVYRAATDQLNRHFTLSIVDCGSTMDAAVTREVLGDVDALIVVSSPWFDGASAAGQTLEWLANGGFTALLHRTVVVINDSDGHADKRELKLLAERFGKHGQKVIQMPYDGHLRPGGVIDIKEEINPLSRRRLLELAAECAEHFAATSNRPSRGGGGTPPPAAPRPTFPEGYR
jgi:MinD-like ATPase involved in chromosome partitioning or flagellar assembly